jgi:sugar lactone lactonase YvrE
VLWQKDGCGPSAVIAMGEGFAVTCYDSGEMVRISATGETIDAQAKDSSGGALVGPNDGTPDGKGGIYFTTSGPWESGPIVGCVLDMAPDGTIREVRRSTSRLSMINRPHPTRERCMRSRISKGSNCRVWILRPSPE